MEYDRLPNQKRLLICWGISFLFFLIGLLASVLAFATDPPNPNLGGGGAAQEIINDGQPNQQHWVLDLGWSADRWFGFVVRLEAIVRFEDVTRRYPGVVGVPPADARERLVERTAASFITPDPRVPVSSVLSASPEERLWLSDLVREAGSSRTGKASAFWPTAAWAFVRAMVTAALTLLSFASSVWFFRLAGIADRARARVRAGQCWNCAYKRGGDQWLTCPECGARWPSPTANPKSLNDKD